MKYLIDVDELEREGVLTGDLASTLRASAGRDVSATAINFVLGFGATAVAAGLLAEFRSPGLAAALGAALLVVGYGRSIIGSQAWSLLANIWMVVGALTLSVGVGALIDRPVVAALVAAAIYLGVGLAAGSRLLMGAAALALAAAVGGSTGYWSGCYAIAIREPTLTIALFCASRIYRLARRARRAASIYSTHPHLRAGLGHRREFRLLGWFDLRGFAGRPLAPRSAEGPKRPGFPPAAFAVAWALALLAAGYWGVRNGRRFMVNAAAAFGAINFYTQWFERLGMSRSR